MGTNSYSRKYLAVLLAALVALLAATGVGCGGKASSGGILTVDQVKLKASDLGPGWRLASETKRGLSKSEDQATLAGLESLGATTFLNQVFKNGAQRLQVNLVQMPNADGANEAAGYLVEKTGDSNLYATKSIIAIELISELSYIKEKALRAMGAVRFPHVEKAGADSVKPGLTAD